MLHRIDNTTSSLPAEEVQELRRLLSGVAAGSQDDLAELYRRTRTAVYGLALSYLRNAHDAQDLTQDVFVHIWDTAGQYRPTGSPVGWILAVCRNLCLMHLRRESRQVTMEDREIGQALGLPLATVLSKYHRALKKMRAYMEGDDAR